MPYADAEKQREFQRKWIAEKTVRLRALTDAARPDHHRGIRDGTTTWERVEAEMEGVKTWDQCVAAAQKLAPGRSDRYGVAALALEACRIKWGGDRRTDNWKLAFDSKKTLTQFAVEAGVNKKTLWSWVQIYGFLKDYLPKDEPIDFTAASMCVRDGELTVEHYRKLIKRHSPERDAYNVLKMLSGTQYVLEHRGFKRWRKEDVRTARAHLAAIAKALKG